MSEKKLSKISNHQRKPFSSINKISAELADINERLNDVELNIVDAKEFSHISGDAFEFLQNQINELKTIIQTVLGIPDEQSTNEPKPKQENLSSTPLEFL